MRRFGSLRRRADFIRLRRRGRRGGTDHWTIYRTDAWGSHDLPLVGISISKAVGKAVTRNTMRRRLQAALQVALPDLPQYWLFVARPSAAALSFHELSESLRSGLS